MLKCASHGDFTVPWGHGFVNGSETTQLRLVGHMTMTRHSYYIHCCHTTFIHTFILYRIDFFNGCKVLIRHNLTWFIITAWPIHWKQQIQKSCSFPNLTPFFFFILADRILYTHFFSWNIVKKMQHCSVSQHYPAT